LGASTTKSTRSPAISTRGNALNNFVDLRDDDAAFKMGCLDDSWRVLGVRTGVKVSFPIGTDRSDQCDMRREIHEVTRKKLNVSVDSAELDLTCV
jgi:hypothetical protein